MWNLEIIRGRPVSNPLPVLSKVRIYSSQEKNHKGVTYVMLALAWFTVREMPSKTTMRYAFYPSWWHRSFSYTMLKVIKNRHSAILTDGKSINGITFWNHFGLSNKIKIFIYFEPEIPLLFCYMFIPQIVSIYRKTSIYCSIV